MEDYEANYFDFSLTQTNLPYITAVGSGPAFAYHKSKALSTLRLFAETTCVCAAAPPVFGDTASATLTYDATGTVNSKNSTIGFGKACVGECAAGDKSCTKSSSMIEQRNPTCDVRYYRGGKAPRYRWHLGCILLKMPAILLLTGLGCCHHLYYLLDKNQSHLVPSDDVLSYRMKARFYFQVSRLSTPELPLQDTVASDDSWSCGDRSTSRSGTSSSTAGTGRRPWARASTTSRSARRARRRRSACIRSTRRSR